MAIEHVLDKIAAGGWSNVDGEAKRAQRFAQPPIAHQDSSNAKPVPQGPAAPAQPNAALVSQLKTLIRAELSIIPEFAASDIGEEIVGGIATEILKHLPLSEGRRCSVMSRPNSPWWSRCPKGHFSDEYFWAYQCLAVICPQCEMVYDPKECRLEPRPRSTDRR
jgi:hypothetical protein